MRIFRVPALPEVIKLALDAKKARQAPKQPNPPEALRSVWTSRRSPSEAAARSQRAEARRNEAPPLRFPSVPEMDGQRVKAWEARCIEEQPPACATACPLHLDVRTMLEKMKSGDFVAAFAVYARFIPFPAILSHICDHPCEPSAAGRKPAARSASPIGASLRRRSLRHASRKRRRTASPSASPSSAPGSPA